MNELEELLKEHMTALKRYVHYKISDPYDAEDILQEVCLAAVRGFPSLKSKDSFKAWIIGIAGHKCNDYYRVRAKELQIPIDNLTVSVLTTGRMGYTLENLVVDTLNALDGKDKQILYLYFFRELPQRDIAEQLHVPLGTVKSRLHHAKAKFKERYPYSPHSAKGEMNMKSMPKKMPKYSVKQSPLSPFSVRWEELQGWPIVPRLGEKRMWGLYDAASGERNEYTRMEVVGEAEVHGIRGVEIVAVQYDADDYYRTGSVDRMERRFVAQLTDTHCRYLSESHIENGVRKLYTFLDGDAFMNNWGFGADNCGNEVNRTPNGILNRTGSTITGDVNGEAIDIVGRYTVSIGDKEYDTVCVMDVQCFNDGVASEQYLDREGRTVLWRRFNKNNWAFDRYGKLWSELLPDNERITVNGETYVHWYDCITDYIL